MQDNSFCAVTEPPGDKVERSPSLVQTRISGVRQIVLDPTRDAATELLALNLQELWKRTSCQRECGQLSSLPCPALWWPV
ncbi:hypothetical protein RRG08_034774 [Elysia crispata]|uniref:Uncharacterized protein n=1 Tax=Elysia crispata TaxID=231223 RepID=A0AAE1CVR4_9GAST|nr:hypothetical protein RRG08_034774 [Elysia crispata]